MEESKRKQNKNIKFSNLKIFQIPFSLREFETTFLTDDKKSLTTCETQIIEQAFKLHSQGKILQAAKYYKKFVSLGFSNAKVYSNYASLLHYQGNLKAAESFLRKALDINPSFADAYSNLAGILKDKGKTKEAEKCLREAIRIKPDFANAYYNLAIILRDQSKLKEAELLQRKALTIKPDFANAFSSLGNILKDLGELKEAEKCLREAIRIKPDFANAHYNLSIILTHCGRLKEAELSLIKAIQINPDFAEVYYSLSSINNPSNHNNWIKYLFSDEILINKSIKDKINIYFARENILYKQKKFDQSAKYLKLANNLKLHPKYSSHKIYIEKSKKLFIESEKKEIDKKTYNKRFESIFIVGMPRSGSTLLESILSMNDNVNDLGEVNILEESFLEYKFDNQELTLAELYWNKVKKSNNHKTITTNKWLYNYQYAGIIANKIPNSKIIHCFRNPLDNILSIYRAHFARGNEYSSSLIDCSKVYLDQDEIMTRYKNRFRSKIYNLNYDSLVKSPNSEIKALIFWLGWEWDDSYLSPHLNPRSVLTRSNVEVRSPINSKSVGGWKKYKKLLNPAIDVLSKSQKYKNSVFF